ncbi:putative Rossmann-fold nucleotide-binding protein [Pseudomonas baetica]|nr:putative Rossmann-fold nucleotide-binding protein [Pseudomonas baetica]
MVRLGELDGASTLVMCGDQDIPRPPEEARELAELFGCPWLLVPEAEQISRNA